MTRYRALVEYDGTAYNGFQRQRQEPTIQGALEQAIQTVAQQQARVIGAGRTDSGVHALGQVIAFDVHWTHGLEALQRALNANLPADIAVLHLEEAAADFHPRYSARRRAYKYHIYNAPVRSPLQRWRSWHVSRPLDLAKMDQAAVSLVGTHDFATFGQPPKGENSVRQVFRAGWQRHNGLVVFEIEANAFLYRMVRSLVGTMKVIGEGNWSLEAFEAAFRARDRSQARQSAPAHGLYLVSVTYDE
ncbi:MAG: tRNA pseudouridine(38-40) synthase TruA [Chloroflexi bacterium]|nr:tRNA pseudouridine(38-40) synthase TruA [Chloroflexota bacterium]MCI0580470.1 tRNA pseudouridine(38-40) synthase TruA [Chloroflexota bacterium]MCI0649214.1 tRNA pseudouridine(38-40) synthase TruA [Chloroflexota bacterium]MCI0727974.1 tRNA pseudouridine(38-40) synthase TruA [Chloroflexota bacterium]